MKRDNIRKFYQVLKREDENLRKITLCNEPFAGFAQKELELGLVNVETLEGLTMLMYIKNKVMVNEKAPVRIEEEEGIFYYVAPTDDNGVELAVVFNDEGDSNKLFLNLEETIEKVKEREMEKATKTK